MNNITIKNGEGKWLQFTITKNKEVMDLSEASFKFAVKKDIKDTAYKIEKIDSDFDKSEAAAGKIKVNIKADETTEALLPPGDYKSELKIIITDNQDVDKSFDIPFAVKKAVIHD